MAGLTELLLPRLCNYEMKLVIWLWCSGIDIVMVTGWYDGWFGLIVFGGDNIKNSARLTSPLGLPKTWPPKTGPATQEYGLT